MRKTFVVAALLLFCAPAWARKALDVYFIDVEGGQSTLFVSPSGETMLVDAGWPGFNERDANRILTAAKLAHVKQIDFMLVTHYHLDHVGGVPQLAARIPIRSFVDHGPSVETGQQADELYANYQKLWAKSQHLVVKPGDKIPIEGIEVTVLTAAGNIISQPLPGAGKENPLCKNARKKEADPSENARSIGILVTLGKFRMIDLGDLTWNKELELACPINKVGKVDVYLTTHHGLDLSGAPALVQALHPQVAIMNNGPRKGGNPEAWQTMFISPGLDDIWQLHRAVEAGDNNNAPERLIANPEEKCQGNWIRLTAGSNGHFAVTNGRTHETIAYTSSGQ